MLQTELVAIQRAYAMVQSGSETKVEARVLFLVVQKRHHTRFFPTNSKFSDKNGNVLAGTLVDHTITHPTEFDFFLVSHQSIQVRLLNLNKQACKKIVVNSVCSVKETIPLITV